MIGIHQYRQICGRNEGLETVFACQKIGTVKTNHFRYQEMFKELWGFEPLGTVLFSSQVPPTITQPMLRPPTQDRENIKTGP